ncbi:MAG TPA: hypothetical protein VNA20_02740 [Frankiaceae bacterium]|nr:hypothetical protein [Frankiaceae bacterium]
MKRVLARLGTAVATTATVLALAPAPSASAFADQCTNEPFGGTTLQTGTPTSNPPSSYRVTTEGVQVVVGPIGGVGTLDIRVTVHEVGVALRGGTGIYAGVDQGGGSTYGALWELALCGSVAGAGGTTYVDTHDEHPGRPGLAVRVFTCSPAGACTMLLNWTGVEVDTAVPARTCAWFQNNQQNPGGFGSCRQTL